MSTKRERAAARVHSVRGSDDAPGFEACVAGELSAAAGDQGRAADLTDLVIVLARALGASNAPYRVTRGQMQAARERALLVNQNPATGDFDIQVHQRVNGGARS